MIPDTLPGALACRTSQPAAHPDNVSGDGRVALVTGATGFVGSHLAEVLTLRGWKVRLLVRDTKRLPRELRGLEAVAGTLEDSPESLAPAMHGVDTVFHVAGLIGATKQAAFDRVNVTGTENLMRAAANTGLRRFLLVSSLAAFGPSDGLGHPRREDDPPAPRTMYGRSKLAGEQLAWKLASELAIPLTTIRPPAVYGPRDRAILEFFALMAKGLEVSLGRQARRLDLIHGRDLALGIALAGESGRAAGESYQITDGGAHDFGDVMKALREVLKPKRRIKLAVPVFVVRIVAKFNDLLQGLTGKVRLPNTDKLGEMLPTDWTCDGTKAREQLGFTAQIPLIDGLRETGDWYQEQGWIKVRR